MNLNEFNSLVDLYFYQVKKQDSQSDFLEWLNPKNKKKFTWGETSSNIYKLANKLKEKIFGIENNLEELNALDFKKGCYIGQENTSRIKLRSKLRRRLLPVKLIKGKINENEVIKFQNFEVGRILIDQPYPFAIVKLTDPNINKFLNENLQCESGTVKIFAPKWLQL